MFLGVELRSCLFDGRRSALLFGLGLTACNLPVADARCQLDGVAQTQDLLLGQAFAALLEQSSTGPLCALELRHQSFRFDRQIGVSLQPRTRVDDHRQCFRKALVNIDLVGQSAFAARLLLLCPLLGLGGFDLTVETRDSIGSIGRDGLQVCQTRRSFPFAFEMLYESTAFICF